MPTPSSVDYQAHLEKLLEDIRAVVHDGEDLLKTGTAAARQKALAGARVADSYVREHPYQGLGVSLGLGIALGLLASRIFSSRASGRDDSNGM
jgi:ElaB/YqjD/DUF883 family membrane-anchored ribosome-binding protein